MNTLQMSASGDDSGTARSGLTDVTGSAKALDAAAYRDFIAQRFADARRVLAAHMPSALTGCCLNCGRPNPCPERQQAAATLTADASLPRRIAGVALDGYRARQPPDTFNGFDAAS